MSVAVPPVSRPPRSDPRRSGPRRPRSPSGGDGRRPSAPPLRPAAVAGLALLLALASLAEPPADAPVGAAPAGVEAPGAVTPSARQPGRHAVVPVADAAADDALMDDALMDDALMDDALMDDALVDDALVDDVGIVHEPAMAVDGEPPLLRTAAGADPFGAARPAAGGAPAALDTLLLDHQ